jgi:hypothetical protein
LAIPTTSRGAPARVFLSDQSMATTDATEALIEQNNTPTIVGILTTVGILILSLVMLKGVFAKGVAYLGIATGALGIVSEALRFALPAGYAVYGRSCCSGLAGSGGNFMGWARPTLGGKFHKEQCHENIY